MYTNSFSRWTGYFRYIIKCQVIRSWSDLHLQCLLTNVVLEKCSFLFQTPDLCHSVVSPTTFRAEYRRGGSSSMFSRNVRFQVDITPAHASPATREINMYCLTFTQISGELAYLTQPGPGCSKLTTLLVNETLKFQTLISQICQYFLLEKCEKLLQCKSFSHFFNKKYQCIWL